MPRISGTQFFNGCYVYVDYTVGTQEYLNNRTQIWWTIGVHNGNADIRYDNAQATFGATGGTSGDATPGPVSTGWPTPAGQNQDQNLESGWFWANHASDGTCLVTVVGSVSSDFGSSSINSNFGLPNIPQTPASPTLASASRVNDGQISVSWTNNSTATAPYANVKVYRRINGGSWSLRATLGVVTTYSDTSVSSNNKYEYRMSAVGQNGVEVGYATSNAVWLTPGAPTNCVATKLGNGDIQVTWTNNVNYSEYQIEIQESTNGGSSWTNLNTAIASGSTSYTHVTPNPAVTHTYRVRAKTSSGTTLFSAYSAQSNTVTLLSTADPPTNLAPTGVAKDGAEAIILTWTHNPTDGTPQSSYRIQYEVNGGATQTIGPTASATSSHTLPAATLANGGTITWRVATAGENGTLSANSATASFTTSARPTSTISVPSGAVFNSSHLTAEWAYFQEQASPQASWQALLYLDNGGGSYSLLEQQTGTTESQASFATTLLDGVAYAVRVYVTSAAGLASIDIGTQLKNFTVTYLPPANATITTSYDADQGFAIIAITGEAHQPGITEPIATVDLQRQINGGEWVTWVAGLVLSAQLVAVVDDTAPTINGTNVYRAVVKSALPSSVLSPEVTLETNEQSWGFLSAGDGFTQFVKMRAELDQQIAPGRDKATYKFAGRTKRVELSGEHTNLRLAFTAILRGASSTPEELEEISYTESVVLWRDYTGRRIYASLSGVRISRKTRVDMVPVSFNLEETDYDENVG